MDYEKKYKNALELAKDYFKANQKLGELEENDMLSDIFPELKESEDERIRKEIISIVKSYRESCITEGNHRFDDCIAWLEKQGESIGNDMKETLRTEYEKGRADAIAEMQNLAWSEEDEEFLRRAINVTKDAYPMTAKWLKSLRTQNKWKPSNEQIKALHDLNLIGNISYAGQGKVLIELYNDLLKLKT